MNGPNELVRHITEGWRGLQRKNTLAYWPILMLWSKWRMGLIS